MEKNARLFNNVKFCKSCNCLLSENYKNDLCPNCLEMELFAKVREYIRANDVTERDVAAHFNLPLSKVKTWIREGRIERKSGIDNMGYNGRCAVCGKPIALGNYCAECMQEMHNNNLTSGFAIREEDDGSMRFKREN